MQPGSLVPHPEGGRYREVFRSRSAVSTERGASRSALTHIYFELAEGEFSGFHRVASEEVWNLYRGDGVRLILWDGRSSDVEIVEMTAASEHFCHVVPAGWWQATEAIAGTTLVGCSVAPGFEFDDFEMMTVEGTEAEQLLRDRPELSRFVKAAV